MGGRRRSTPSAHRRDAVRRAQFRRDAASGRGIDRRHLPGVARQHEPPADERGVRDDVAVGDPPADRPVRLDRERLDLRLDEDVGEPRRAEDRDQRGRRAVRPAERAGPATPARTCGSRTSRRAARRRPRASAGRLVADRRGEAGPSTRRPARRRGARRGTAARTTATRADPRSSSVPPASVRAKTAAPWPLPAQRQRARSPPGIDDRRVARLAGAASGAGRSARSGRRHALAFEAGVASATPGPRRIRGRRLGPPAIGAALAPRLGLDVGRPALLDDRGDRRVREDPERRRAGPGRPRSASRPPPRRPGTG